MQTKPIKAMPFVKTDRFPPSVVQEAPPLKSVQDYQIETEILKKDIRDIRLQLEIAKLQDDADRKEWRTQALSRLRSFEQRLSLYNIWRKYYFPCGIQESDIRMAVQNQGYSQREAILH